MIARRDRVLQMLSLRSLTLADLANEIGASRGDLPDLRAQLEQHRAAGQVTHSTRTERWSATDRGRADAAAVARHARKGMNRLQLRRHNRSAVLAQVTYRALAIETIAAGAGVNVIAAAAILRGLEAEGTVYRPMERHWALRSEDDPRTTVRRALLSTRKIRAEQHQERVREAIADGGTAVEIAARADLLMGAVASALRALRAAGVAQRDHMGVWTLTTADQCLRADRGQTTQVVPPPVPSDLVTRALASRW